MTHILIADEDRNMRTIVSEILEIEGHWVTSASDLWQMLSVVRSTLHPMIVIFNISLNYFLRDIYKEDPIVMMTREYEDLMRHKLVVMRVSNHQPLEHWRPLWERLGIETLFQPFDIDTLLNLVDRLTQVLDTPM